MTTCIFCEFIKLSYYSVLDIDVSPYRCLLTTISERPVVYMSRDRDDRKPSNECVRTNDDEIPKFDQQNERYVFPQEIQITKTTRLARRAGLEREFCRPIHVVDPVSNVLKIRVNVCKPPDAAAGRRLEILTVAVKHLIIFLQIAPSARVGDRSRATYLFTADTGDRVLAVGLNT